MLINRPEVPSLGGGEASIVTVPAAIANAVFDAIGARVREAPLTPDRVLAVLNPPPELTLGMTLGDAWRERDVRDLETSAFIKSSKNYREKSV